MPRYPLWVHGPTDRIAFGDHTSTEAMLQAFADTGRVEVRPFRTGQSVQALLEP